MRRSPDRTGGVCLAACLALAAAILSLGASALASEFAVQSANTNSGVRAARVTLEKSCTPGDATLPADDDRALRSAWLKAALRRLTYREREVIKHRHGLDAPSLTLNETAKVFHVTKERIRQVEAKALRRLYEYWKEEAAA